MKLIIAGSRNIEKYDYLYHAIHKHNLWQKYNKSLEIVCGLASGADMLGNKFALLNGLTVHRFPADWDRLGKRAGHIRNKEMAVAADALLALWDGESTGTKNMIETMRKMNKPVYVYTPTSVVNKHKQAFDVYIGRGSIWGNPFEIDNSCGETREVVIKRYRGYLWDKLKSGEITKEMLLELDEKRLGCFCSPLQCHGDVLKSAVTWVIECENAFRAVFDESPVYSY